MASRPTLGLFTETAEAAASETSIGDEMASPRTREPNKDRLLLWIEALESGEWTQCLGVLEATNYDGSKAHCCLGVAQRVAFANGFTIEGMNPDDLDWGSNGMDPGVGQWYGFDSWNRTDPDLVTGNESGDGQITCVDANDMHGWTFAQIAAGLRARYITPTTIEQES